MTTKARTTKPRAKAKKVVPAKDSFKAIADLNRTMAITGITETAIRHARSALTDRTIEDPAERREVAYAELVLAADRVTRLKAGA
jgi:hypothetical protein